MPCVLSLRAAFLDASRSGEVLEALKLARDAHADAELAVQSVAVWSRAATRSTVRSLRAFRSSSEDLIFDAAEQIRKARAVVERACGLAPPGWVVPDDDSLACATPQRAERVATSLRELARAIVKCIESASEAG